MICLIGFFGLSEVFLGQLGKRVGRIFFLFGFHGSIYKLLFFGGGGGGEYIIFGIIS